MTDDLELVEASPCIQLNKGGGTNHGPGVCPEMPEPAALSSRSRRLPGDAGTRCTKLKPELG